MTVIQTDAGRIEPHPLFVVAGAVAALVFGISVMVAMYRTGTSSSAPPPVLLPTATITPAGGAGSY